MREGKQTELHAVTVWTNEQHVGSIVHTLSLSLTLADWFLHKPSSTHRGFQWWYVFKHTIYALDHMETSTLHSAPIPRTGLT